MTAQEGRKFGLTVGGAFVVIAALMLWRGHSTRATWIGSLGGLFMVAGLLVPTYLGPVEQAWMKLAHAISKVTTPIFMGVVYFLVITPIGILRRAAGNPLRQQHGKPTAWATHEAVSDPARMERQF